MSDLENQLAAYTQFLEDRSLDRAADHTTLAVTNGVAADDIEAGDVIVLDLKERTNQSAGTASALRRRAPLIVVAAAAALIILVICLIGFDDESSENAPADTETPVTVPVDDAEPETDAEADVAEVETIDLGERITGAIRDGQAATVEAIYSPDVVGVFEGTELPGEIAYPILTDVSMRDLVVVSTSDCGEWVETGTVSCRFHHDYAFLDDITEPQSGDVTFTLADGVIVRHEQEADDFPGTLEALAPYREWVQGTDLANGPAMFNSAGMWNGGDQAPLHAEKSAEYNATLALLDGAADLGAAVTGAIAAGDIDAVDTWYAEDVAVSLEGTAVPTEFGRSVVTDVSMRDLVVPRTSDCSPMRTDGFVVCAFHLDFAMLDDVGEHSGSVGFALTDGVITEHNQTNDDFAAMVAELAGYRTWVETNHPDDAAALFNAAGMVISGDDEASLHAERSAEYNATLG
ncbi:MAG: hypothetical protein AAF548_09955 [Actinomycetota bacterium]